MSHLSERKEKICLNCRASIYGRFCHVCGQENIEAKESFWHLLTHFFYDITHFDGKFFSTLQYLLFRPGYLSHEYLKGRRADYLHPIKMYVFTSAFFFLILFNTSKKEDSSQVTVNKLPAARLIKKLEKNRNEIVTEMKDTALSGIVKNSLQQRLRGVDSDLVLIRTDSTAKDKLKTLGNGFTVSVGNKNDSIYKNVQSYDSIQKQLAADKKDNFIKRRISRQTIHLKEKYNNDSKAILAAVFDKFLHTFPQMLFVSLPLFALMLQLLYVRKKDLFYVNHVVFTIHLYCGIFIIILAEMGVEGLFALGNLLEPGWLKAILILTGFFYWYKCMRNFYQQRRAKTIVKYCLAMLMSLIIMVFLFTIFFTFSAMSI